MSDKIKALSTWRSFKNMISMDRVVLGRFYSHQLLNTPRNILFTLSRYKFAAKLIGENKTILEAGCNQGLGTVILSEFAKKIVAVDIDPEAIKEAKGSFVKTKINFRNIDIFKVKIGKFDAVVSFDLIEHVYKKNERIFFCSLLRNLKSHGICIIGTPNELAKEHSSRLSSTGHVNYYSWRRLKAEMEKYFYQVLLFSVNDEIVHTGFYPMAHYFIAVGVCKK